MQHSIESCHVILMQHTSRTDHVREVFVFPVFYHAKQSLMNAQSHSAMNVMKTRAQLIRQCCHDTDARS